MTVEVKETDQLFGDSPDTGHPDCKCSRCGEVIKDRECPLRMWPTVDGEVTFYEYRYCEKCMTTTMGIYISPWDDDDDFDF